MSFIQMGDQDTWEKSKEPEIAPEGKYDLLLKEATLHVSERTGNKSIRCSIAFPKNSDIRFFYHYLPLPNVEKDAATDEAKGREPGETAKMKALMVKRSLYLFGVAWQPTGFDLNALQGKTFRGDVGVDKGDDGVNRNVLKVPSLPDNVA